MGSKFMPKVIGRANNGGLKQGKNMKRPAYGLRLWTPSKHSKTRKPK